MVSREYIMRNIEHLEAKLKILRYLVNDSRSQREDYLINLESSENILEEIKSTIQREPFSPNEINRIK
jgi:hypothetical protein